MLTQHTADAAFAVHCMYIMCCIYSLNGRSMAIKTTRNQRGGERSIMLTKQGCHRCFHPHCCEQHAARRTCMASVGSYCTVSVRITLCHALRGFNAAQCSILCTGLLMHSTASQDHNLIGAFTANRRPVCRDWPLGQLVVRLCLQQQQLTLLGWACL